MTWIIDDVPLSTLAFNISNRSAGWKVPPKRGENLTIPGRNGARWLPNKPFDQGALTLDMWVNGATEDGLLPVDRSSAQQCRDNLDKLTALFAQSHRLLEVTQISGAAYGLQNVMSNPGFTTLTPTNTRTYRNVILNPAMRRTGQVTQARNLFANPNVLTGQVPLWVPVFDNAFPDPLSKYNRSAGPGSVGGGNYWAPPNFENYNSGDTIGSGWLTAANTTAAVQGNTASDQIANPQGGTKVFRAIATAALALNALLGTRISMYVAPGFKPLFRIRMRRGMAGSTTRGVQIRLTTMKSDGTTVVLAGSWQTYMLPAYTGGGPADWIDAVYNPGSLFMDGTNAYGVKVEFRTNEAWLLNDALILDLGMMHIQGADLQGTVFDGIAGPYFDGDSAWGGSWSGGIGTSVSRWFVNTDTRWKVTPPAGASSAYWAFADRTPTDVNGTSCGFVAYGFTTGGTQSFYQDLLIPTQALPYSLLVTARALTGATCTIELQKKGTGDPGYTTVGSPISVVGSATPAGVGTKMTGATTIYVGPAAIPDPGDLFRVRITVPVRTDGYHIFQYTALSFTTSITGVYTGDSGSTVNSQYAWAGETYNSASIRSLRAIKRIPGARNVMVSALTPVGYTAQINTAEVLCLADDYPSAIILEQIALPGINRGLYIRSIAMGAVSSTAAAGTATPTLRADADLLDSGGATLATVSGTPVLLNPTSGSLVFLPVTVTVPPESIPDSAVAVRVSFVMVNPKRATYIEVGEFGVYDIGISPARLGMPDYFSNTASPPTIWLGTADDAQSEYRITAPLGYTTGSAVPYVVTGALAAKSSLANQATVTIGHPLGATYTGGRYLIGTQTACKAEDSTGTKVTGVPVQIFFAAYAQGVQVATSDTSLLSGNEIFDYFQGTFDVPGDFDELRITFTAQPPIPSSITAEIKSIYLFENTDLCPLARTGINKAANPDFNDALTFWGYSGAAPTAVSTTKGAGYTLGLDTRLSGSPFVVRPGSVLNVALWGADGLRSTIYWNAVIARRNLCPNPSFEASYIGYAGGSAAIIRDTAWTLSGTYSAKITPNGVLNSSSLFLLNPTDAGAALTYLNLIKGRTYTVSATLHLTAAQTGTLDAYARSLNVGERRNSVNTYSPLTNAQAPNAPGDYRLSLTFTVPTDTAFQDTIVRLVNGSANLAEPVWWDCVLLEEQTAALTSTNWLKDPSAEAANLPDWTVANATKQRVATSWPGKVGANSLLATANPPNLIPNPTFESTISGWTSGVLALGTNLALNPSFEGGSATGWNTNSVAAYPTTLDTSSAMSGVNSLRADRLNSSLSNAVSSIVLATAGATSAGFPVTVGQPITASLDIKHELANRKIGLYWAWLDAANAAISNLPYSYSVADTGAANSVRRAWVTGIPPAGAVSARLLITTATVSGGNATVGERVWFDNLRVSSGPGTLDATNQFPNPGVESASATYWSSNNATLYPVSVDSTAPITGSYSILSTRSATTPDRFVANLGLTGTSTGSNISCTPGTRIYMACDLKAELTNRRVETYFSWYDAAGVYIANGTRFTYTALPAGQVVRAKYSEVPPANAVNCRPIFAVSTVDSSLSTAGERVWFDNGMVGASDLPAFSGFTQPDGTYVYRWTGTPWATSSERWAVTGPEQTDITYFDGSTTTVHPGVAGSWTGTANASTSTKTARAVLTQDTTRFHYGAAALRIDASAAGPNVLNVSPSAAITGLTIGQVYTVGFWIYCPAASIAAQPAVRVVNVAQGSTPITTPDVWTWVPLTFTATATSHTVYVANSVATTQDYSYYIDDVAFFDPAVAPIIYPLGAGPLGRVAINPSDVVYGQVAVGAVDVAVNVTIGIVFYDASGGYLSATYSVTQTIQPGQTATLNVASAQAPGSATGAWLLIYPTLPDGTSPPGMALYIDAAIVQVNQTIGEYFDGSTTGTANYAWTGTANASPSTRQAIDYFDSGFKEVPGALYRWNNTVSELITFTTAAETETPNADGTLNLAENQLVVPDYATSAMLLVENPQLPVRWSEIDPNLTWDQIDPALTWAHATEIT